MTKSLIVSIGLNIILAVFALKSIASLNMEIGGLKVEIIAEKGKSERLQALYDTEHTLVMESNVIDHKVKERIAHALEIIERAYSGTVIIP